jgi:hypothetical protein
VIVATWSKHFGQVAAADPCVTNGEASGKRHGVNAKALSAYLGHASITITLDRYGHLIPGSEDEAAGLLDAYLERANTKARLAAVTGGAK